MKNNNQWELLIDLLAPAHGSFSPINFLMTSSFQGYDFEEIRQLATNGDHTKVVDIIHDQLKNIEDKESFLFEYTIPGHEKRHFVDLISTTFGFHIFQESWRICLSFIDLMNELTFNNIHIVMPLKRWAELDKCPENVKDFLSEYKTYEEKIHHAISIGKPHKIPAAVVPQKFDMFLLRIEEKEGITKPYVAYLKNDSYKVYPFNGSSILEGLAAVIQFTIMGGIDEDIAKKWWRKLERNPQLWRYWTIPKLLWKFVNLDIEQTISVLEWSLMIPIDKDDYNKNTPEYDPAWRLYYLFNFILKNRKDNKENIIDIIDDFSKKHNWKNTKTTIKETKNHIKNNYSNLNPSHDYPLQTVMYEYLRLVIISLDARDKYPLMGMKYVKEIPTLPPMTKRVLSDGSMKIRVKDANNEIDEAINYSWIVYAIISNAIKDSIEKEKISCPLSTKKINPEFPESHKCDCEMSLKKCYTSTIMEKWLY